MFCLRPSIRFLTLPVLNRFRRFWLSNSAESCLLPAQVSPVRFAYIQSASERGEQRVTAPVLAILDRQR